jgi:hypothetical protein
MSGDLEFQLNQVTKEFAEFKAHNDLDRYFALGMDVPRCQKLLERIKELQQTSDWHIVD